MTQEIIVNRRITSIDILRGVIIVLMGLDHIRDFLSPGNFSPLDVTRTTPAWFFTRWITHYCAPTFVFLAGLGAFIYGQKVSKAVLTKFLWTRGLWLLFLEFTFVKFGWTFEFHFFFLQVIWVIGWSMIILSLLIHLPRWFILAFTLVMLAGHNLLDTFKLDQTWWKLLHVQNFKPPVAIVYPLIPWPAVMSFGYLTGALYQEGSTKRKFNLFLLGSSLVLVFLIVRLIDRYGDLQPWESQPRGLLYTVLDFLDTTKYPPSLLYVCMTLGPSIIALAILDQREGPVGRFFQVFGRVPFFYYVVHIYTIHLMTLAYNSIRYHEWRTWAFGEPRPPDYHPSLYVTYIGWIVLTTILYFLCRWFGRIKQRYDYWWLKYL